MTANDPPGLQDPLLEGEALAVSDNAGFRTELNVASHALVADEPVAAGGTDAGPSPYGLLSAALAACTAMTLHAYARMKRLPLTGIRVLVRHDKVHAQDCATCDHDSSAKLDRMQRRIWLGGDIGDDVRARLLQIAERCPVHRTLQATVQIETSLD